MYVALDTCRNCGHVHAEGGHHAAEVMGLTVTWCPCSTLKDATLVAIEAVSRGCRKCHRMSGYVSPGAEDVILDGTFTREELEHILTHLAD